MVLCGRPCVHLTCWHTSLPLARDTPARVVPSALVSPRYHRTPLFESTTARSPVAASGLSAGPINLVAPLAASMLTSAGCSGELCTIARPHRAEDAAAAPLELAHTAARQKTASTLVLRAAIVPAAVNCRGWGVTIVLDDMSVLQLASLRKGNRTKAHKRQLWLVCVCVCVRGQVDGKITYF